MSLFALARNVFAIYIISAFTSVFAAVLIPDNSGIDEALISSIASNSQDAANFIAGTDAGLYQTFDKGKTWSPFADKSFGTQQIKTVMINPQTPDNIFISSDYYDITKNQNVIEYYSTTDRGAHWAKLNAIQSQQAGKLLTIYHLSLCPFHQNELIAQTNNGVYFSGDSGLNWKPFSNIPVQHVEDIYFSNSKSGLVYLSAGNAIYQSLDHGQHWTKHTVSHNLFSIKIVAESADSSVIYLEDYYGVYRFDVKKESLKLLYKNDERADESDSGRAFNSPYVDMVALPDANHTLILVSNGKMQFSLDQGDHWQEITNTPFKMPITIKSYNAQGFLVYTTEGLFWGNATATDWYESVNGLKNIQVYKMGLDDNGVVYAGTGANLWRKVKNNQWQKIPFFKDKSVIHLAFMKNKSGKQTMLVSTWFNLYLSEDDGQTWQKVLKSEGMSNTTLKVNPLNSQQVFVTSGPRVAQSIDGGKTWSDWKWFDGEFLFSDIAFNPMNAKEITLISDGAVYLSFDGGKTWNKQSTTNSKSVQFSGYHYDPLMLNHAYALQYSYPYIYETMDAGKSYTETGASKLPVDMMLRQLIIDPDNAATLYAVFSDSLNFNHVGGVYVSKDKGANWMLLNSELATQFSESAQLMPDKSLYLGTGLGIYHLQ